MKKWVGEAKQDQRTRSKSHSRQFRQVISFLQADYPPGHFMAYCLVSKQSSYGIFLNQRLLTLDSLTKELKYYSHIPKLPLASIRDLPSPKQVVKIAEGVHFHLDKIRIGHVEISWEENSQKKVWKILMGSNRIRHQFYSLYTQVANLKPQKNQKTNKSIIQSISTPKRLEDEKQQQRIANTSMINHAPSSKDLPLQKQEAAEVAKIENISSQGKLNISLNNNFRSKQSQSKLLPYNQKILEIHRTKNDNNPIHKSNYLLIDWLYAQTESGKALLYNKFIEKCSKKVENIMENFISSHLMHEEYAGRYLIRDKQVEIYYTSIIQSVDEQDHSENLFSKIDAENQMVDEWQCLNYLSTFQNVQNIRILVPMICILTYKSFKFYCKSSAQLYPNKTRIYDTDYDAQIGELERLSKLSLRNGLQQIHQIRLNNQIVLYFERISCKRKITKYICIQTRYVEKYINSGVISNKKDIAAISNHISNKLIKKLKQNMEQKLFFTSCQLLDYLYDSGLSIHYLPFFLEETTTAYTYVQKLVASEILAYALEVQIRKRMQQQFFKKRQFGFALNQIRICFNLFLQSDHYFLKVLQSIIKQALNFIFPSLVPLANFINFQLVLVSALYRLGFDCKGQFSSLSTNQVMWSQKYVSDYIQFTPYINPKMMRFDVFCKGQTILKQTLFEDISETINLDIKVEEVLAALNIHRDSNGFYQTSNQYEILPNQLKIAINYYLSHFLSPSDQRQSSRLLQNQIYLQCSFNNFYTHKLQYLTTLNKIRWFARIKYEQQLTSIIDKEIQKSLIWSQLQYLIQIYGFYAKWKLKQGQIRKALQFSLKALEYSQLQYDKQPTATMEFLMAESSFEAANMHFKVQDYSKALQLYQNVQKTLSTFKVKGENTNINAQFLEIYVNKCSITLMLGDLNICIEECQSSLIQCEKLKQSNIKGNIWNYQFKIYEILFRCYQIKNMRKQLIQVSNICALKYIEEPYLNKKQHHLDLLTEVIKMQWFSVIKQVQMVSTKKSLSDPNSAKLKVVYLKKVKQQLKMIRDQLNNCHRYEITQIASYIGRKIAKHHQHKLLYKLQFQIIHCLSVVSLNSRSLQSNKIYDKDSLENQWLMLEALAVVMGFNYMIGLIDDYLHIYEYSY